MFAVIKTGGKQYKVAPNDVILVEKLDGEPGAKVSFDEVLMMGEEGKAPQVGAPTLSGVTVGGEIIDQSRADKVVVFKKIRRHNYRRRKGHRQHVSVVRITDVGGKKAETKKAAPKKEKAEATSEDKAAAETETKSEEKKEG